jgi:Arc/MetJ-type ribon-helix-helix transcriptional regulator
MGMKNENSGQEMVSRHIRFPESLDAWLSEYALTNGFSSAAELVRQIAREFRDEKGRIGNSP